MGVGRRMGWSGRREGACWRGERYGGGGMIEEREGEVNWAALERRVYTIQGRILYRA